MLDEEKQKICKYAEYNGLLRMFKCSYDGECSDKLVIEKNNYCGRTTIVSREDMIEQEIIRMMDQERGHL